MNGLETAIYAALTAFAVSVVLSPALIPALTRLKVGQNVRDDGPSSHLSKSGTPTMGGIIILISIVASSLFFMAGNFDALILMFVTAGFGLIGFLDDYTKVVKRRSLGLRAYQKIALQLFVTGVFALYIYTQRAEFFGVGFESLLIPFTDGASLDLGVFYLPFIVFVMIGTVNSVNLTDGLDGLAGGVTLLVCVFFVFMAWAAGSGTLPIAGAAAGSLLAFLLFNAYPAKILMGDTCSLALGGLIAALASMRKLPLFLP
ncbi:MAG: phospho-N-acetylmuramoyl-pentapeptide-transferase, partial [Defluviitaleaceae bacterium]|nr:phospho-N-acetylmuramoyl-pentapeptide-transferase [Defluviitaleaceae bacterium]